MRKFLVSLLLTIGFCWLMLTTIHIGGTSLPPLGEFLSPFHGFWQQAEKQVTNQKPGVSHTEAGQIPSPGEMLTDEILDVEGLHDRVRIVMDQRLVPHIFATNLNDALFAQGYITARHRLWQMDISTRAAAGRISEVLGKGALEFDRSQREHGLAFAAERAIEVWKQHPEDFAWLEAYTRGINTWIEQLEKEDYPIEFKLLQYQPELWSPLKSALFAKSMAQRLCSDERDLEYSNLHSVLGDSLFQALYPEYNPMDSPVIPKGTVWPFATVKDQELGVQPSFPSGWNGGKGLTGESSHEGSNNWAVGANKTASGNSILCNDPHLDLTLPSTWYELHIVTPEMNCYGMSLPGVPGIIIGWNEHIAWGSTNVGQDVLDWYTIKWTDNTRQRYYLDGAVREVEWRREVYHVKGRPDIADSVAYTVWGPVSTIGDHAGLAMRWLAHDYPTGSEVAVFSRVNATKNFKEFRQAFSDYYSPAQNFVYADTKGNVGMVVAGRLPKRQIGTARTILDGSVSSNGWKELIPYEHNPYTYNPAHGFVASANQQTTDETYPYYYGGAPYFEDYRGRYLNRKLASMGGIEVREMQELQMNAFSLKAEEFAPVLLTEVDPFTMDNATKAIYDSLVTWDYIYDAESEGAVYFDIWWSLFEKMVWDEMKLLSDSMAVTYPEDWVLIDLSKSNPANAYFDHKSTERAETFGDIARITFEGMADSVLGFEKKLTWGEYREFTIRHLARLPGFGVEVENLSGHGNTLNAIKGTAGPSMRMVVEMRETPKGFLVYPGGQSGNPGSSWYRTGVDTWAEGNYFIIETPGSPDAVKNPLFNIILE